MTLRRLGMAVAVMLGAFLAGAPAYAASSGGGGGGYDYGSFNRGAVVSTTRPHVGQWFVVGGSGFAAGSTIYIASSRGGLSCYPSGCAVTANRGGRFYVLIKLNRPGRTSVTAVGTNGTGGSRAVGLRVTVRGPKVTKTTTINASKVAATSPAQSGTLLPVALGLSLFVSPVAVAVVRRRRARSSG